MATWSRFVYLAFVADPFSRRIVGWRLDRLRADLALDALEHVIWERGREGADLAGLIHHSDRSVQYLAIRYTERLAEIGAIGSVGSVVDSYDIAATESARPVQDREDCTSRLWCGLDHVERATLECIDWLQQPSAVRGLWRRSPVEFEQEHYPWIAAPETLEEKESSLHRTRGGSRRPSERRPHGWRQKEQGRRGLRRGAACEPPVAGHRRWRTVSHVCTPAPRDV